MLLPDRIAQLAIETHARLPAKYKPVVRSNGVAEWTILAAIVLVTGDQLELELVSLASGVKCLPYNRLPPCGDTLHDQHAEVLAKRGFRRWLVDTEEHPALERVGGRKRIKQGVGVYLYVSALPCGDASLSYTAAYQPVAMAAMKGTGTAAGPSGVARGRNGYGAPALRTKPGRPDSFPAISMSCSDKIASWNVLGLQGGLLAREVQPVYLSGVVIGGVAPPREGGLVGSGAEPEGFRRVVLDEARWALVGRVQGVNVEPPYRAVQPDVALTTVDFPYAKQEGAAPMINAMLHLPHLRTELLYQGCDSRRLWKPPGLVPLPRDRQSAVCKREMMDRVGGKGPYWERKQDAAYQQAKQVLRGVRSEARAVSGFERCGPLYICEGPGPFAGWLATGREWESWS